MGSPLRPSGPFTSIGYGDFGVYTHPASAVAEAVTATIWLTGRPPGRYGMGVYKHGSGCWIEYQHQEG